MHNPDIGKLILRLTVGILMLFHGVSKLTSGIAGIKGMLAANGLPQFFAYGVFVGEIIAPLMLIVGFYSRIGAALIVVNMLFAIGLAHMGDIFALSGHGGWRLELQAFFLFTALALIFTGPGKYKFRH
ncbi:MAG: GntR family transcriptional regulator [Alcanivorax sp.]|uniref:DoxX family protein n=1 Tax=Isoalcanivorax indicus TaxID=2202653 RepID=UPI000DB9115B|nr:DoxX family protein [Isoalcanivorax indicus]MBA3979499.1 GntR family transcriptional regulator [Alcanivorax sp.]